MQTTTECLECLHAQAKRALNYAKATQSVIITPQSTAQSHSHTATNPPESTQHTNQTNLESIQDSRASFAIPLAPPKAPPPYLAISVYQAINALAQTQDIYKEQKAISIQKAKAFLANIQTDIDAIYDSIRHAPTRHTTTHNAHMTHTPHHHALMWGLRLAAIGNVIDYGSANAFCIQAYDTAAAKNTDTHTISQPTLQTNQQTHNPTTQLTTSQTKAKQSQKPLHQLFHLDSMEFAICDIEPLKRALHTAGELVYIGDNAGEDVFDSAFIEILQALYPQLTIRYFTRGAPIINDITMNDLHENQSPILRVCEVVDSGVKSAGFLYDEANAIAKSLYDRASVILAKGMGNFECLEDCGDERVFLLFKIKCAVVARFLDKPEGSFILHNVKPKTLESTMLNNHNAPHHHAT